MKTKKELAQYEIGFHEKLRDKTVKYVSETGNLEAIIHFTDGTDQKVSGLIAKILNDLE